jgi:hypothetical protein
VKWHLLAEETPGKIVPFGRLFLVYASSVDEYRFADFVNTAGKPGWWMLLGTGWKVGFREPEQITHWAIIPKPRSKGGKP